jgi:phosphohistidine phosphatase SixA
MRSWRKVDDLNPGTDDALRGMVAARVNNAGERRQVEKDLCLIEAALNADRVVVSTDERARRTFVSLAPHSESLGSVKWINPVSDRQRLIAWMEGSAAADKRWRLGA